MTTYSKINIIYRLQKWMDSVPGQTFLNYAYSWGASIVILGTLFKLTHLPGANFFLFLGMGTEVLVFFISAFDRPFDKTTDGMELDIHTDTASPAVDLTGICKVYELQLKSASSQIGTIDDINEQTRKMAAQIADLNKIYARMIEAMTAKMNV